MNIRKNIDYSAMFAAMDTAMATGMSQMELYCQLGALVCERPEKGAAVAAAEYLKNRYQDASGFSPRNLRRMRDFYRIYGGQPELLKLAMEVSWTHNVVILEAELNWKNGAGTCALPSNLGGQRQISRKRLRQRPIWNSSSTNQRFRAILNAKIANWSVQSMIKILFLCHGNICRSPMAEFIMKDLVKKANLEQSIQIESAATSTEEIGNPVYPPARRKLSEHGIDCSGKRARQLLNSDYEKYDLLIGMDHANMRSMYRICGGDFADKMHLLMDFTNRPGEVADPWYTGDFDTTWRDVEEGCQGLLQKIINKEV